MLIGYYKGPTRVLQGCYKGARLVLQVSFKRVTRMSQECYRSVSSVLLLQGYNKGVLRVFVYIAVISATQA